LCRYALVCQFLALSSSRTNSVVNGANRSQPSYRPPQVFRDILGDGEAEALASFADVIFLGIKPQYLAPVLVTLARHLTPRHTIVSIAAGWTMSQLEAALPVGTAVMRVMPNTPILVGEGASVYCLGKHAGEEDRDLVHSLLSSCGIALEVSEDMMDAAVGVSGSGPAYMFQVRCLHLHGMIHERICVRMHCKHISCLPEPESRQKR
jgi:pyrroline-5-carboxylate reductase